MGCVQDVEKQGDLGHARPRRRVLRPASTQEITERDVAGGVELEQRRALHRGPHAAYDIDDDGGVVRAVRIGQLARGHLLY